MKTVSRKTFDHSAAAARPLLVSSPPESPTASLINGQTGVRRRIRPFLHYKRPAFRAVAAAVLLCLAVLLALTTTPNASSSAPASTAPSAPVSLEAVNGLTVFYKQATVEQEEPTITRYAYRNEEDMRRALEPLRAAQWYNDALVDRMALHFDGRLYCDGWLYFSYTEQMVMHDSASGRYLTALPEELWHALQEQASHATAF